MDAAADVLLPMSNKSSPIQIATPERHRMATDAIQYTRVPILTEDDGDGHLETSKQSSVLGRARRSNPTSFGNAKGISEYTLRLGEG